MKKTDLLLIKHFMGETTPDEEQSVAEYKKANKAEYMALKKFWKSEGKIVPLTFDTQKALDKVKQKVKNRKQAKKISLFSRLKPMSIAASILLIVGLGSIWLLLDKNNSNVTVTANNELVTGGEIINLEDGTTVYLNKNASLSYPKAFDANKRELSLKGEAFFEVAKDKNRPFIINMNDTKVTVLGTSFNINNSQTETNISVASGKVRVKAIKLGKAVEITKGESAIVNKEDLSQFKTKNKNYLSWKTGKFIFENVPIKQVIIDLNTYYNNKIISNNTKSTCTITAEFDKKPLNELIEILNLTCETLEIKIKN